MYRRICIIDWTGVGKSTQKNKGNLVRIGLFLWEMEKQRMDREYLSITARYRWHRLHPDAQALMGSFPRSWLGLLEDSLPFFSFFLSFFVNWKGKKEIMKEKKTRNICTVLRKSFFLKSAWVWRKEESFQKTTWSGFVKDGGGGGIGFGGFRLFPRPGLEEGKTRWISLKREMFLGLAIPEMRMDELA